MRKELLKLLQTLVEYHCLSADVLHDLLNHLLQHAHTNMRAATRHSQPGLLLLFKHISTRKEHSLPLITAHNGSAIRMLASMLRSDDQNNRPLKQCFRVWLQIMSNILEDQEDAMKDESEAAVQVHIDNALK